MSYAVTYALDLQEAEALVAAIHDDMSDKTVKFINLICGIVIGVASMAFYWEVIAPWVVGHERQRLFMALIFVPLIIYLMWTKLMAWLEVKRAPNLPVRWQAKWHFHFDCEGIHISTEHENSTTIWAGIRAVHFGDQVYMFVGPGRPIYCFRAALEKAVDIRAFERDVVNWLPEDTVFLNMKTPPVEAA
jgi:hypothetical protein